MGVDIINAHRMNGNACSEVHIYNVHTLTV